MVIQEWWGMNDQIKKVADTLKNAGYRALVLGLMDGKGDLVKWAGPGENV